MRVHGDAVALGRAVAGGDGRGRGDDGFHLRVDGGERVGFPDADGRRGRYRLREGDLRGGGQRGRSADGGALLLVADGRVTVFQASPTVSTDHPIERGVKPVRAIRFLELRARFDALRMGAGL